MSLSNVLHVIGYASGLGAGESGTQEGPLVMQQSVYLKKLAEHGVEFIWQDMIQSDSFPQHSKMEIITAECQQLAQATDAAAQAKHLFCVLGGDHSAAVGTWSGLSHAFRAEGPVGLIWIDAHMDSHTHHTTPSGNVHGMPVASLLGQGMPALTQILNPDNKIRPEYLCLIGVRSFERGEAALLKEMNVRIFFMEEVRERGLLAVMQEALEIVTRQTAAFGISIDIDGITPEEAPGTGTPVPNGIATQDLYTALQPVANHPKLAGFEIVEFDPSKDKNKQTEKVVTRLISTLVLGNDNAAIFKDCCESTTAAD